MDRSHGLTSRQVRAARALLDWSQDDLADASGLSVATVRKIEAGSISPRGHTTSALWEAFEEAGLEFIHPGGVRIKPDDITIYQGPDGVVDFFDNVYHSVLKSGGEIVVVSPTEVFLTAAFGLAAQKIHLDRMTAIQDRVKVKCILTEDISERPASYCEYRFMSKHYVNSVPFYVYDNCYAIIVFEGPQHECKITVIQSQTVANAFRRQFASMWDKAAPIPGGTSSSSTVPHNKRRSKK